MTNLDGNNLYFTNRVELVMMLAITVFSYSLLHFAYCCCIQILQASLLGSETFLHIQLFSECPLTINSV